MSLKAQCHIGALIAMRDQHGLLVRLAPEPGYAQRVDDDVGRHVVPQGPTHHLAAKQVDDESQVRTAIIRCDARDVADFNLVRLGHSELTIEQIG